MTKLLGSVLVGMYRGSTRVLRALSYAWAFRAYYSRAERSNKGTVLQNVQANDLHLKVLEGLKDSGLELRVVQEYMLDSITEF